MQKTKLAALAISCSILLAACGGHGGITPATGPVISKSQAPKNGVKHPKDVTCATAWQDGGTYNAGDVVSYDDGDGTGLHNYTALVNQTDYAGTGYGPPLASLWQDDGTCGGSSTSTPAPTPTPGGGGSTPTPAPTSPGGGGGSCYAAWSSSTAYTGGQQVTYNGENYTAAYWTQGNEPDTNSGPAGSGQPWVDNGPCSGGGGGPTPTPAPTSTPVTTPPPGGGGPPPSGLIFSPYKDITVGMNWNTDTMQSFGQSTWNAMPSGDSTLTWAFATGECGSENWAGVTPSGLVSGNVQNFVNAGKYYIISTGGANGAFTCGSTGAFLSFIQTYYSSNMVGVDFDIESGQTQSQVDQLVSDVQAAQSQYPNMRFSFTVATLGGSVGLPSGGEGAMVVNSIKNHGLGGNYTVDLMAMDYGSPTSQNCIMSGGQCEMGQSAVQAAMDLNQQFGIPYGNIELCPMVGPNDSAGEDFTIGDADTVASFVEQNGLAGVRFWSFDRDSGLSYTNQFINDGI